ncbi:MAG: ATP-binding protein [Gemmatimonadales bacterium]
MVTPTLPHAPAGTDAPEAARTSLTDSVQRDKLALIGQMASSVAHELSNPLATIVASAQAILAFWPRNATSPAPAELLAQGVPLRQLREDLELILAEARRAGEIVHGLLASARQHPPEWCICSMADVVRRTVTLARHHLKLHNVALQSPMFDPFEGYPLWSRLRGDANQLQQVLLNLVINAQQAITATRGYGTVRIALVPVGPDRIRLVVEDDGPGVPHEIRDQIFQPFYTTKPAGKGTGLGLSISAEIIHAHGGAIAVSDREGGGAVFTIELPSLSATERPVETVGIGGFGNGGGSVPIAPVTLELPPSVQINDSGLFRVLLVDDEAGVRRSISRLLRRSGFSVTEAAGGEAALEALRQARFDVVLSDLRMPGLSGEQFFERIRSEFPAMTSRVVFTSGDTLREESQQFLKLSGCPALQKPYELAELIKVLRSLGQQDGAGARRALA